MEEEDNEHDDCHYYTAYVCSNPGKNPILHYTNNQRPLKTGCNDNWTWSTIEDLRHHSDQCTSNCLENMDKWYDKWYIGEETEERCEQMCCQPWDYPTDDKYKLFGEKNIMFNPNRGTTRPSILLNDYYSSALVGEKALNGGRHYWEITIPHNLYCTEGYRMFGIATKKARLYNPIPRQWMDTAVMREHNQLGFNEHSWVLDDWGLLLHHAHHDHALVKESMNRSGKSKSGDQMFTRFTQH